MSSPGQNTSLSPSARLLCYIGPPSAILLTSIASPRTGLFSPVAFIPSALFFRRWRDRNTISPSRWAELEPIIWTYAATGTIGLATAILLQMGLCTGASTLLFRSASTRKEFWDEFQRSTVADLTMEQVACRNRLAGSWQNWVFNGVLTFVAAGLVEELLKYLPIAYARRRGTPAQRQRRDRAYLDYALAGALSFGVVENIGFLYTSCEQGHETWSKLMLTLCERILFGSLGHLLTSALTALRAIRRDYGGEQLSLLRVVGPSVILHGMFDFVAMSSSAVEGNVGWIHPTGLQNTAVTLGLLMSLVSTTAWQVWGSWKVIDGYDRLRR